MTLRGTWATPGTAAQRGDLGFLKDQRDVTSHACGQTSPPRERAPGPWHGVRSPCRGTLRDVLPEGAMRSDEVAGAPFPGRT